MPPHSATRLLSLQTALIAALAMAVLLPTAGAQTTATTADAASGQPATQPADQTSGAEAGPNTDNGPIVIPKKSRPRRPLRPSRRSRTPTTTPSRCASMFPL
jgi:hypothetical protein